jgi:integrase
MKINLTDVGVRALRPPLKGQLTVWDKTSPLGVRVSQGGSKTYIIFKGEGRRHTIARADAISLSEARIQAKRLIAEKTLGIAPPVVKSTIKFGDAVELFIEDNYRDKKPRTKLEANRLLTSHFQSFKVKGVGEITDRDISSELTKLTKTPSEQLHAFRALRTFFRWCIRPPHRYITHSPLEGYPAPGKDRKGKRILSDQELAKVWKACEGYFGDMIRLLILWGCRNGEIGRLKPEWREGQVMTIPGTHTKNSRAHAIPLLPMARAILERNKTNREYFFMGQTYDSHFNDGSWGKLKKELDARSGVTGWQVRDLRRTFRSNLARLKVPRELAEVMLNHVTGAGKNDLDEIYNRYDYIDEKREALKKLETHIRKITV